jgi:hypothetical protein
MAGDYSCLTYAPTKSPGGAGQCRGNYYTLSSRSLELVKGTRDKWKFAMEKIVAQLVLTLASFGVLATPAAEIKMDGAHLQLQSKDGSKPQLYVVNSSNALQLDASAYKQSLPGESADKPANSIQLILEKNEQYSAAWKSHQDYFLLNTETLTPNPGSVPFHGLRKGQEGVVAVGHMDSGKFSVYWVGMFKVQ